MLYRNLALALLVVSNFNLVFSSETNSMTEFRKISSKMDFLAAEITKLESERDHRDSYYEALFADLSEGNQTGNITYANRESDMAYFNRRISDLKQKLAQEESKLEALKF